MEAIETFLAGLNPWMWLGIKIGVVVSIIMGIAPMMIMADRKISAWIQGRKGPNRVGPLGLMQPLADIVKLIFKEQFIPAKADKFLFLLGPILVFLPPAVGFAVLPFGNQIGDVELQIADLNIGVLFLMSVLSVGVYGITLGGWASNNKYSLLGSLRAAAQLISYELTLGLSILLVVMMAESVDPQVIVQRQVEGGVLGWNVFGGGNLLAMPMGILGFMMLCVSALAENNRLPFDMAECEAELVGGYHTEYSSMNFGMFMLSEYVAMILMSALITTLYLGGWYMPFVTDPTDHGLFAGLLSIGVFVSKMLVILFCYVWVRWTLPRFRYDQIMNLGWKALLPLSLVNVAALAVVGVVLG